MDSKLLRRSMVAGVTGSLLAAASAQAQTETPSTSENSYLWVATSWHELAKSSYGRFRKAVVGHENAWTLNEHSPAMFAEMGVWNALLLDAQMVVPPNEYRDFHNYLVGKFEILESASRHYTEGILLNDMESVRTGAEFFNQGDVEDQEFFRSGYAMLLVSRSAEVTTSLENLETTQSEVVQSRGEFEPIANPDTLDFSTGPTVGDPNAVVTMHIFSDFQCSFCKSFYEEVLPLIKNDFVESAQVKLRFHDFPRMGTDPEIADWENPLIEISDPDNESAQAAHAAMSAGEQGQYLAMSDLLFKNFGGVQNGAFSRENLGSYAESLGLNMAEFYSSMNSGRYLAALAVSVQQGQACGIAATPMFILDNGVDEPDIVQQTAEGYTLLKAQIEAVIQNLN